jgi:hypothetical protein
MRDKTMRWQFCGSLLLHAAILAAVIFLRPIQVPEIPGEEPIHVEIVEPPPLRPTVATKPEITQKRRPSPLTADKIIEAARNRPAAKIEPARTSKAKPEPDALIVASQLYSARLLADRHNRSARAAMKTLAADERIIQLCNIEAMEQVRRARAALKPDYVIAYAMADLKLSAHEVDAEGGAFLSHRNWYGLKFRCGVSPDDSKVVAFAFLVGEPIPKSQWASHNLTADASSAD